MEYLRGLVQQIKVSELIEKKTQHNNVQLS